MKQEEKSKRSFEKILRCAIKEFANKPFEEASINAICSENQISKGLLYHNFKSKDELYLRCVQESFTQFTQYLQSADYSNPDFRQNMQTMLAKRHEFFIQYPLLGNLFFQTILQPPKHLLGQIRALRHDFDAFHAARHQELLGQITLRDGVTPQMAMEYFSVYQEMFNAYFQTKAYENSDFHALVQDHEARLTNLLDIMLYGIAKENA